MVESGLIVIIELIIVLESYWSAIPNAVISLASPLVIFTFIDIEQQNYNFVSRVFESFGGIFSV